MELVVEERLQKAAEDSDKRFKTLEHLNEALAALHLAEKRFKKASSELGTAESELAKALGSYLEVRKRLLKLLPDPSAQRP